MPKPRKYIFTDSINEEIIKLYQDSVNMHEKDKIAPVKSFANKIGVPPREVTKQARRLGIVLIKRLQEPDWSKPEIEILERYCHKSPQTIAEKLRNNGFNRTPAAIVTKKCELKLTTYDNYSAANLSVCFGTDRTVILKWIHRGLLKASKRGTDRLHDDFWITPNNVKEFIIKHISIIDLRKVDKWWFVDILTNKLNN